MSRPGHLALAAVAAALIGLTTALPANATQPKVVVCHSNEAGEFHAIHVPEPALAAHLTHGDGLVGEAVPGMADYVFGEGCNPEPAVPPDPIERACYASDTFNDLEYVGPVNAPGNVVSWPSFDGSCSGVPFGGGEAMVVAGDLAEAVTRCEALGLTQVLGEPLNGPTFGYSGLPPNVWFCNVP